ncbi:general secretion pathway protein GspK [Marinobacter sp. X15-166B]|nr:general secretion pathway protein GspK [Marinobacter sp. X15-166B]
MVLLAMALVVMLVSGMTQQQSVRVFRTGHYLAQQQALSIALGSEAFAQQVLIKDLEQDKEDGTLVDSPDEFWNQYAAVLPVDDRGVVEVQIDDLGGRINLNNLVNATTEAQQLTRKRVARLLELLDISSVHVEALIDWVDADDQTINAYGAEDGVYLQQDPPYRAANQPFVNVSELRLIDGMTEDAYQRLLPHVTVVPVSGLGINVNMASGPVLQALDERLTAQQAAAILAKRKEGRFESLVDFLALPEFAGLGMTAAGLSLQTYFFEVVSQITYDDRTTSLVSLMFRNPEENEVLTVQRDSGQKNRITKQPFAVPEG